MTTLIVCIKRRPDLTHEAFSRYWRDTHAPLLRSCGDFTRHLCSYTQYHLVDRSHPVAAMFGISGDYDGVAVLAFRDAGSVAKAFAEPAYLANVRPDESAFVDLENCLSFVTDAFEVVSEREKQMGKRE